ncbi:MAG TPA: glycosyl hydrolase family 28-related protein, partial [Candidatus Limnocylindrales bacterium]|nr:glycosyl hydrolase family 28-related protein [Candidatus Limnocylindrales bacterium]
MSFWDGTRWTDERPVRPALRAHSTRARRLRDWLATIPIILLVPALIIPMVPVGARSATLTVDGIAVAGGQISVVGMGFPGRESIQLAWDGSTGGMPLVTTSPPGRFSAAITVPLTASAGTHTVSAFVLASAKGGDRTRSSAGLVGTEALATVTVAVTDETPGPTPSTSAAAPEIQPPASAAAPSPPPVPTANPTQPPSPTAAPTQPPSPTTQPPTPTSAPTQPPSPTVPPPAPTPPPPDPTATPAPAGLNVRDYGAKGDGASNDTAAFNAALQASLTRGKVVYVPNGTYALTRLIMPAGVTLRGQDRGATVLKRYGVGAHAAGGFIHIENVADVGLENLTLRGTG